MRRNGKQGVTDEMPVLALIDTETVEARSQVIPDVTGDTLREAIREHADVSQTTLHTDALNVYRKLGPEMVGHEWVCRPLRRRVRARRREHEQGREPVLPAQAHGEVGCLRGLEEEGDRLALGLPLDAHGLEGLLHLLLRALARQS
jgi:hypothetical protein